MKINPNEEFYSLPFYVDKRVLIPRNDTEILVDKALKHILESDLLIDIWIWSWAIAIAINKNTSIKETFWLDISKDALEVAKINLEINNLSNKIKLVNSDLLEVFLENKIKINNKDIVFTANLPYIKNWDFKNMDKEVLDLEPHIALFWWEKTWFEMYEKLIWQIIKLKEKLNLNKVILFIEIWFDQYDYSNQYLSNLWLKFEYFKDLNNIYRVIKIIF